MNLLAKIQRDFHGEPVTKIAGSHDKHIEKLNKLPDKEKVKVLEYLTSLKELKVHE